MAAETGQERTEQATPKRLKESREKGQVPRSKELNSMALLMGAAGGFFLLGENILQGLKNVLQDGLIIDRARGMDGQNIMQVFGETAFDALIVIAPLLLLLTIVVIATPLAMGGWIFSMKSVSFKIEKLDPIKGMGKIFSLKGLMELVKVLAKFVLVSGLSALIVWSLMDELLGLGEEPVAQALAHVAQLCAWSFLASSSVLILIAAVDVPFQLWQHSKELKMTKQEIKDENKETDGRPEVKGQIRKMQYELSQRRMMEAVPDADVVITNPTHYAVALRYDTEGAGAPIVVAKGADLVAARIRGVAEKHSVAMISEPPLARALFASTEVDQEIPAGLYIAVATILAYVYQLSMAEEQGMDAPEKPTDLPIPDELKDAMKNRARSKDEN